MEYIPWEDGIQSWRLSWLQTSEGSSKLLWPKGFRDTVTRDRPIYRLIFGLCWYITISQNEPIYRSQKNWPAVGVDKALFYSSRIQSTCIKNSYLAAMLTGMFYKQADKFNHRACVSHRSWNKSIIGKFHNAWSLLSRPRYCVQVLRTNKLPL